MRMIILLLAALCRASAWAVGQSFTMSVSPAFLGGEFVWTNSCCPVVGSGLTFSYSCDGNCRCTGCAATGYYAYEGYRLPATGGACGCDASGGTPPSEDDDREPSPLLSGATAMFSKRVIFFEDDYDNAPGETIAFRNTYRAVRPSGSEDDIVVTATFEENVMGWTSTSESKATAVKVTISPQLDAPGNASRRRHKFGVGEVVDCLIEPASAHVSWACSGGGTFTNPRGNTVYTAPLHSTVNSLKVVGDDSEFAPQTSVVAPQGVVARNAGYRTSNATAGQAGGICLTMTLHVVPLDVSFLWVKFEEVPDVGGSHSGYFADTFFMSEWLHGIDQKAGTWLAPYGDNAFLNDEAGFTRTLPQLDEAGFVSNVGTNGWKPGSLIWEVPCGWALPNVQDGDDPVGVFAQDARQVMTIDADGNCEVRKHSNWVRRNLDDTMFLNGVQMK